MVVVDCLEHLLVVGLVSECIVALAAQGHQVVDGVGLFAASHTTSLNVMDVDRLRLAYLAGNPIGDVVAHPLEVDLSVIFHFW